MVKKTYIAWLLTIFLLLLSGSTALATPPSTGFKIWSPKTTTDVNKAWTISFDAPLLSASVNSTTVYVTNSKQTKVATTTNLSSDGLSVTVTPSRAYTAGDYNLFITNGITSWDSVQLSEMVIVPFTVSVPSQGTVPSYTSSVNLVVTVTNDFNAPYTSDLSGALTLVGQNGNHLGPFAKELSTGKYTFNINAAGDYALNLFSVNNSNSVINTRSVKLPTITLPILKIPTTGLTTVPVKTAKLVISTQDGVNSRKSGAIGGSITPVKLGVPVTVSNSTSTWTTTTDIDGNFMVYLPTGTYQLNVDSDNNALYKKHSYKLTVTAGQMATPVGIINEEDPINRLGLTLDLPVVDAGAGVLSGISATTTKIDGTVNSDATVYLYDTVPATPALITTVKPDQTGKFTVKLPSALSGKKLQIKVIDSAENVYRLDMIAAIS